MKRVGIILSGCGVRDGSEIHEATLALLWTVKNGCEPVFMAPDDMQKDVVDHRTNEATGEKRNCLTEAARIARGKIRDIADVHDHDYDAILMPGGSGAVKNLLTADGAKAKPEIVRVLREAHRDGKPIGAICIAPVVVARAFKEIGKSVTLTIGNDAATAEVIRDCGHEHVNCKVDDVVIDRENKIVSTPAYMLARNIGEVEAGVSKLVSTVVKMMG
jgi:enhancing lycopene biosynthesis protein 2